jgi:hypothetical protein
MKREHVTWDSAFISFTRKTNVQKYFICGGNLYSVLD